MSSPDKSMSEIVPGRISSRDILWLSLTLFILLSIALLLQLSPQDYWWYLRLGQDIAQTGSIPTVDTYSYTQAGTPFIYQPWLAALILWMVYQAGGLLLTFFLRAVIVAITYGLLWLLLREESASPHLASLLILWAALAGSSNWSFRPQLFTYPLFVLTLYILLKWYRGSPRGIWVLPVLSALWVNLHGSFPLLFIGGVLALIFGRGDRKRLAIALALAGAALFISPHGIKLFEYLQVMLNTPSQQYSLEWHPMVNEGWQANLFFLWILLFAPVAALSPRKLSILEWAWFLAFGWLALSGIRYVIWFLFILALLTAPLLGEWSARLVRQPAGRERPALNISLACLFLLLPFALLPGFRESWWPDAPRPYDIANPVDATKWLADHPELKGPLWSDFSHSSYLIFALPSRPVWIDPRWVIFPPEQWQKYQAIASASPNWQKLLDEEGTQLVMLSTHGEPLLISAMRISDDWCESYQDEDAVIFSRRGSAQCP